MKTQQELIETVAIEHANYLVRQAGGNIWGYKKMNEMVEGIIKRHTENNTPIEALLSQVAQYNEMKKQPCM